MAMVANDDNNNDNDYSNVMLILIKVMAIDYKSTDFIYNKDDEDNDNNGMI